MALLTFLLLLTLLDFHLIEILGLCLNPSLPSVKARSYMHQQNRKIEQACETGKSAHFDPIPIDNWSNYGDSTYQRAFNVISSHINYDKQKTRRMEEVIERVESDMADIYNNAYICEYIKEDLNYNKDSCTKLWPTDILEAFEKTNNAEERKYYWAAWRDASGKKIRRIFGDTCEPLLKDLLDDSYWLREYEMTRAEMLNHIEKALTSLSPLYKQLHSYVRKKLIEQYGEGTIKSNGPIPEHFLGLFGSNWWAVKKFVEYNPKEPYLTQIMKGKGMNLSELIEICEKSYEKLGFERLGQDFWRNLKQTYSNHSDCEDSVFAGCNGKGANMTICRNKEIDEYDFFYLMLPNLISVHYEKWINQQHQHFDWPKILNGYSNPAFEFAFKGLIDISASSREFTEDLNLIGLPEKDPFESGEIYNHLLRMCLWSLVNVQYAYTIAKWKLDLASGTIRLNEMNRKWWEYSLKYRGVSPPMKRTEFDFDPGALPEVALNMPIARDLLGAIYQFQFHQALCILTGTNGSLPTCNIFRSCAAGNRIREVMEIGRSKPWQEAIRVMTGNQSNILDTRPLLDYYDVLYKWLKEQNKDRVVGWEGQ